MRSIVNSPVDRAAVEFPEKAELQVEIIAGLTDPKLRWVGTAQIRLE